MFKSLCCCVVLHQPATQQYTEQHSWQYTYTDGFLKYRMLPEDGLRKTENVGAY